MPDAYPVNDETPVRAVDLAAEGMTELAGQTFIPVAQGLLDAHVRSFLALQGLLNESLRFVPAGEDDLRRRIHAALQIRPNG